MEMVQKKRKKVETFDIVNLIILTVLMIIVLVPFYLTVVQSFMTQQEYIMNSNTLWPKEPTLGNYRDIFCWFDDAAFFRKQCVLYGFRCYFQHVSYNDAGLWTFQKGLSRPCPFPEYGHFYNVFRRRPDPILPVGKTAGSDEYQMGDCYPLGAECLQYDYSA